MDGSQSSRTEDHVTDAPRGEASTDSGSGIARRTIEVVASDEGFRAVLSNLNSSSRPNDDHVSHDHVTGSYVDGEYTTEDLVDVDNEAQEAERDGHNTRSSSGEAIRAPSSGDRSDRASSDSYARAIRPSRLMTSSLHQDHREGDDLAERSNATRSEDEKVAREDTDQWTSGAEDDASHKEGSEWQEMMIQVGDDGLDRESVLDDNRHALDVWAQTQANYVLKEAGERGENNTRITSESGNEIQTISSTLEHRTVTFTPETRDNEGISKRYVTEGFPSQRQCYTVVDHSDTWPPPSKAYPETRPSWTLNNQDNASRPAGQGSGRVFPGNVTALPPIGPTVISPNQTGLERGIRITETDTWMRTPDNTSVIRIETSADGTSLASYSRSASIAGASFGLWASGGSLNQSGSTTHPTMLATSAAYAYSKHGLMANGGGQVYKVGSAEKIKEIENTKASIEKERRQRKYRLIVFAVMTVLVVAAIVAILLTVK